MEPRVVTTTALLFGLCFNVPVHLAQPLVPRVTTSSAQPPPAGCDYRDGHYKVGAQFRLSPCESCFCDKTGHAVCMVTDCPYLVCADYVHDPAQCCPVCPNGPTCSYNGTVMKAGAVIQPDSNTTCRCLAPPHVLCNLATSAVG